MCLAFSLLFKNNFIYLLFIFGYAASSWVHGLSPVAVPGLLTAVEPGLWVAQASVAAATRLRSCGLQGLVPRLSSCDALWA